MAGDGDAGQLTAGPVDDRPDPQAEYEALAAARPALFTNKADDGIVILFGEERAAAEREIGARLAAAGKPQWWARAGIYYSDPFLWLVRDVVRFPDQSVGTYHRVVRVGGAHGAVLVPRLDGRFVMIRHFRHGAREWSLEFPRGGPEPDTAPRDLAINEAQEEIGARVLHLERLGVVHPAGDMYGTRMHVFLADIDGLGDTDLREAISESVLMTAEEIETAILADEILDANSVSAFAFLRLRGLA